MPTILVTGDSVGGGVLKEEDGKEVYLMVYTKGDITVTGLWDGYCCGVSDNSLEYPARVG